MEELKGLTLLEASELVKALAPVGATWRLMGRGSPERAALKGVTFGLRILETGRKFKLFWPCKLDSRESGLL